MKTMKRILALALAALMLLSLTACGSFETRMARAAAKMSKLQSVRTDVDAAIVMNVSLLGESVPMSMKIQGGADSQKEPGMFSADLDFTVQGTSQKLLMCGEKQEDKWIFYSSADGGATWTAKEAENGAEAGSGVSDKLAKLDLKTLAGLAAGFSEKEKTTVNGEAATVYEGVIPAEMLKKSILDSGVLEKLSEAMEVELDESVLDDVGDVPVTISLDDKTDYIVRVTMDLSAAVSGLAEQLVMKALAGRGETAPLAGLNLELGIETVEVSMDFSRFNSAAVEIPEAARAAA